MPDNRNYQSSSIRPDIAGVCHADVPEHNSAEGQTGYCYVIFPGERLCKKVKCGGKKGGVYPALKIDIGAFWRLLSAGQRGKAG
ncbi:hypothetical protein [Proteus mirabilis]